MKNAQNIYLIGLMGAGKTTIGRQLAKRLNMPFYDSDKAIEEETGVDIPTIFSYEGEDGFREREQQIIKQLTQLQGIVLATGGGAILREANRETLQAHGFVVYLHCAIDKILHRTQHDTSRPLLQTEDPKSRLEALFSQRDPLYSACADFKIDSGSLPRRTILDRILREYRHSR